MKFVSYKEAIDLELNDKAQEHFNNDNNYTKTIIKQMSDDKIYDKFLEKLIAKNNVGVALDIGANIGLFSLYIKDIFTTIFSIEPAKSHFEILSNLTSKFNQIIPRNIAISNETGTVDFYISNVNTTTNALFAFSGYDPQKTSVLAYTLADFIKESQKSIDFMKMDIEGAETFVIMSENFNQEVADKIKNVYIEVHNTCNLPGCSSAGDNARVMCEKLNSLGYKTEVFNGDTIWGERN